MNGVPCNFNCANALVNGNVRFSSIHGPQGEAALLQLGLGVIPVLVHDKLLQSREEAHIAESCAVFQILKING